MPADITDVLALAAFARERGVELPGSIGNAVTAWEALTQMRRRGYSDAAGIVRQHIRGGTLTPETVERVVSDAANGAALASAARDLDAALSQVISQEVTTALLGDDGEELTEQLRPAFEVDLCALQDGMAHITEGMTADIAIERGPDATAAWQAAPATVRSMHAWLTGWATLLGNRFGLPAPGGLYVNHSAAHIAAYFVGPGGDPAAAAVTLNRPASSTTYRLGVFARLLAETGGNVRLNSPAEAVAAMEDHTAALSDAETRRRDQTTAPEWIAAEHREAVERAQQILAGTRRT